MRIFTNEEKLKAIELYIKYDFSPGVVMKILVINHNAGSIKHGMEFRPYAFAREWIKAGHNVTIAAASYSHFRQKNVESVDVVQENIEGMQKRPWMCCWKLQERCLRDCSFGRTLGKNGRDYVARELDYRALAMWYLEVCRME